MTGDFHQHRATPAPVHIRNVWGFLLYDRLLDDGSPVLRFASGGGYVDRRDVKAQRWEVVSGWAGRKEEGETVIHSLATKELRP